MILIQKMIFNKMNMFIHVIRVIIIKKIEEMVMKNFVIDFIKKEKKKEKIKELKNKMKMNKKDKNGSHHF
jgi:hypothetical protein